MAFLATIVAPLEACKLGANIPLVRSPTLVALNPALLGRRLPRPLRLGRGPSIGFSPLLVPMLGPRWSSHSLLVWVLSFHLHFHLLHDLSLLHQGYKVLDGQWSHHQPKISTETVLKFPAPSFFIQRHVVETTEILEFFRILSHRFASLSQLQELHLFSIFDAVREVLREKLSPKDLPSNWFLPLLHDGLHTDPLVLSLTHEHVNREGQPALLGAHLSIKDSLDVLQPLICDIWTGLPIELSWIVLQKVFQTSFPMVRSWFRTVDKGSGIVFVQLTEGLYVLSVSVLSSHPSNLHLLHYQLLLLKRCRLSLH